MGEIVVFQRVEGAKLMGGDFCIGSIDVVGSF
jgi:hypothetical protein